MIKILKKILLGILISTVLIALYLSRVEGIPLREALLISLMLLSAGEPLTLDIANIGWFTEVLVVIQTLLGLATLTIILALLTNFLFSEKMKKLLEKEKITMKNHVILCGLGNVGFRVLTELMRLKQEVVIVDWETDKDLVDRAKGDGAKIINRNLKDETALEEANIGEAKSVIICTGNDLLNMEVALNARERRPEIPIVMRMFDQKLAQKISHAFNIRIAFSSAELAAPVFAAAAIARSVFGSIRVGTQVLVSAEKIIITGSRLDGMTVGELQDKRELSVLKVISGNDHIKFPPRERKLQGGDIVYITCTQEELDRIKEDNYTSREGPHIEGEGHEPWKEETEGNPVYL